MNMLYEAIKEKGAMGLCVLRGGTMARRNAGDDALAGVKPEGVNPLAHARAR